MTAYRNSDLEPGYYRLGDQVILVRRSKTGHAYGLTWNHVEEKWIYHKTKNPVPRLDPMARVPEDEVRRWKTWIKAHERRSMGQIMSKLDAL